MNNPHTYANELAESLAPLLIILRATGFFEAYVFMPLMTIVAALLFIMLRLIVLNNGTFAEPVRARFSKIWLFSYFSLCFIVTNSTAVAFKTMIVEETDYETLVWYLPWVSPLHFYITSVAAAMLWLIGRNKSTVWDKIACVYVQFGFFGGYYIAISRLINESFDLLDPTSGVSGIFFILWFVILNWDIAIRYFKTPYQRQALIYPKTMERRGEKGNG